MAARWIRCVDCNVAVHITDYDCLPSYYYDQKCAEVIEKPMDDEAHFMGGHKGHTMEELFVVKDSFISEGRYGEPLKISYFEATNGTERFVVKGWREDINHAMAYEVIPGYIEMSFKREVQADEMRRQLSEEIKDPPLAETAIEGFIQIVEKVVTQFPVSDRIEITAETDTPLISHCRLGDNALRKIMTASKKIFDVGEWEKVEQFVYQNNDYNEPMTFLLKRAFTVKREQVATRTPEKVQSGCDRKAAQGT
jgi:hypothetical protein